MKNNYKKIIANNLLYLPANRFHPADTYFHFSFSGYHNPDNVRFGKLRALNDDDVMPNSGFDKHSHQEMEVVSYIVEGKLTHWDSETNKVDVLERGHVQAMTTGSGIWHSELNYQDESTRFLQIWILPPENGLSTRYENYKFTQEERLNKLLHIVGNPSNQDKVPLYLNQNINIFVSELDNIKEKVRYDLKAGRQAYINNFEGSVDVIGELTLNERDSLEISGPVELVFTATDKYSHFIIIEMPETV